VKFLVDAQLPIRLSAFLTAQGHDARHVAELPDGYLTSDTTIAACADVEGRVVVSKDADFTNSHVVTGAPARLLTIKTGNISNNDLLALVDSRLADIATAMSHASHVELHRTLLVVHTRDDEE